MKTKSDPILRKAQTGEPTTNVGQFGTHKHGSPECDLDAAPAESASLKTVLAHLKADPPRFVELAYVSYDERLNEEDIEGFLADNYEELYSNIDDRYQDSIYDRSTELAKEQCEAAGVDYDDLEDDDQDELRNAIQDLDTSNPLADLKRNTPNQLMRAPLGASIYERLSETPELVYYDDKNWEAQQEGRKNVLLGILAEHGADITNPGVQEAAMTLVTEGPSHWHEGVTFDVIWYGDIEDVNINEDNGRTVEFQGAHVVLLDTINGSGMDAELPGRLTTTMTKDNPAHLDSTRSRSWGYGWDDTAGVVKTAYRPEGLNSQWENEPIAA